MNGMDFSKFDPKAMGGMGGGDSDDDDEAADGEGISFFFLLGIPITRYLTICFTKKKRRRIG